MTLSHAEAEWLYALQRPWPLTPRPLDALASNLGTRPEALLDFILRLRERGIVRRIGGVFDARHLGYSSCLFSLRAEGEALAQAARTICAHPGVTHAYLRGWPEDFSVDGITSANYAPFPNFWFTLVARADRFDEEVRKLAPFHPTAHPAITRYKIDVVFDPGTHERDEHTEFSPPSLPHHPLGGLPTREEQALVRRYQEDTLNPEAPFLPEDIPTLQRWQDSGRLRRFALLLRHRASGFIANGMCCWRVPQAELNTFGRRLAGDPDVTHCYARPPSETFPFSLYAMIHKTSWLEGYQTFSRLSRLLALPPEAGRVFFSTHEYKKSSMRFFTEGD